MDSLSYDKIKDYKPFDHARNRKKALPQQEETTMEPFLIKTRFGDVDGRTFRTVMTMTGGLIRRYIAAPVIRALQNRVASEDAAAPAAGGSQSKSRPG